MQEGTLTLPLEMAERGRAAPAAAPTLTVVGRVIEVGGGKVYIDSPPNCPGEEGLGVPAAPEAERAYAAMLLVDGAVRITIEPASAALAGQQPRDLAGRVRALSTRWFSAWASLGTMDHQTDAALRMCLDVLRQADRSARGCPEQMTCHELVNVLREWATNAHESTRPVFAKVADELEAIMRDEGEQR